MTTTGTNSDDVVRGLKATADTVRAARAETSYADRVEAIRADCEATAAAIRTARVNLRAAMDRPAIRPARNAAHPGRWLAVGWVAVILLALLAVAAAVLIPAGAAHANGFPAVNTIALSKPTGTTLTVSWTGTNYPLTARNRYRVSWVEQQAPGRSWASQGSDYGIGSSPLKLTGLLLGHTYTVTVAAHDTSGWFGSDAVATARTAAVTR